MSIDDLNWIINKLQYRDWKNLFSISLTFITWNSKSFPLFSPYIISAWTLGFFFYSKGITYCYCCLFWYLNYPTLPVRALLSWLLCSFDISPLFLEHLLRRRYSKQIFYFLFTSPEVRHFSKGPLFLLAEAGM